MPKQPKCKVCRAPFDRLRPMQAVCGVECAKKHGRDMTEKARKVLEKAGRIADRAKREALKTRSDYLKEAQREFNRYVRLRDASQPCICCGNALGDGDVGGAYDAGHYRSVGSAPHLRFHEDNCHAQRKACNRYGAGRAVDYRLGLIGRIGLARVEAIEADQSPRHYTTQDLIAIRDKYRALAKQMEKETQAA